MELGTIVFALTAVLLLGAGVASAETPPAGVTATVSQTVPAGEEPASEETLTVEQWEERYENARKRMNTAVEAEKAAQDEAERIRQQAAAGQERFSALESELHQVRDLVASQAHQPAAPPPPAAAPEDAWDGITDEFGAVDPARLRGAIARELGSAKNEIVEAVQSTIRPVMDGIGNNAKESLYQKIPNGPHKEEFVRRVNEQVSQAASSRGVDPAVINNPESVQWLADGVAGAMQREGKLVHGVTAGGGNGSPAVASSAPASSPEPTFGPDFGNPQPTTPEEQEEDWTAQIDLKGSKDMRDYYELEKALGEHGIGIDKVLQGIARDAKKAAEQRSA